MTRMQPYLHPLRHAAVSAQVTRFQKLGWFSMLQEKSSASHFDTQSGRSVQSRKMI
jgi:hypothetical protein